MSKRYINALEALYGNKKPSPCVTSTKKKRPSTQKPTPLEHYEQVAVRHWLDLNNILYYAIPNGAIHGMKRVMWFKAEGMKPGVPDLCIPMARNGYHGLYIELKRRQVSKLSEAQQFWREALNKQGYCSLVCYGADEAIDKLKWYFNL